MKIIRLVSSIFLLVSMSFCCAQEADEMWDPLEPVNRGIFWFNDQFDYYLLEPVAIGYDYVVPDQVQKCVTNVFRNLSFPGFLLNDIVGLEFSSGAVHTGRFLINSTLGLAGIFDVAHEFGLEHEQIDFGITLGRYGVGPGPYLVLPILGPSNMRDGLGRVVDSYVDPFTLVAYSDLSNDEQLAIIGGSNALRIVNTRSALLNTIDTAKEGSLDYYLTVQSAFHQLREGLINEKDPKDEFSDEDLDFLEE